jgi:hypothetical protein
LLVHVISVPFFSSPSNQLDVKPGPNDARQTLCASIVPPNPAESLIKSTAMASVFTLRNLGIAARVAARQAGRSRTMSAVFRGARASAAHFGKVLHQLWLEVTGSVFLAIAGIGGIAFFREYAKYHAGMEDSRRMVLAAGFTVLFAWFGVTSFLQVKKKRE